MYTYSSTENAVQNGVARVYIQYPGGREDKISLTTGLYSTNYKAEAEALNDDHDNLSAALASLRRSHAVTLQWIPSHCSVPGNEAAASLAKEGTTKEQADRSTSYAEMKTILKAKQHC